MKEYLIKDPRQMEELGVSLARELRGNEVICLKGELGAGKTTFVRGLAKGLGIREGYQVRSPTFTIVNEYPTERGTLIHIDLYRVPDFDWSEFAGKGIVVVEWCNSETWDIRVEISIKGERERTVRILQRSLNP